MKTIATNKNKFDLMSIKTSESRNGYSMSCVLLINAYPVCKMNDRGDGSEPSFEIINKTLFQEWETSLSLLPPVFIPEYQMELSLDKGMFIDLLHAALVNKTKFKVLA